MPQAIESKVTRTGIVTVKANVTDRESQTFIVEELEWSTGQTFVQYYLPQFSKWVSLPDEWETLIVWKR